ncbi:hypothetical protein C7B62_03745 [Pleurocapsa sp. CCALA 161]|uniref:hypothetical protein n=1 Tax=Pleurocapsa sp. CCALA 161 TaxID=2107688 RepID=UPI000D08382A|nr:hypothetical protein [Pleurocapsa sp. CCALA 161]PSB12008.1 hypothetical protein C7B62_03745 [Pleurocapsa sp. CCALA 161]
MKKFLFKLLVVIPAVILGFLLWKYGVDCPFWDEWVTPGSTLVQFNFGQLSWEHLFSQHNESRKFFPRLLFIYLSRLTTNWNTQYGMLISFLLSCLTTFNLYYLSKHTLKSSDGYRLTCLTLASMLIFSPMQRENWLWGLQMITFIPIATITSALVIIYAANPIVIKLLSSAALATFATFCFANGIISWVVIFPALYLVASKNRRSLIWITTGWLLLFSLNVTVYFHDYHRPGHHPSIMVALTQPFKAIAYYLSFLGSPLAVRQLILSLILGIVICLLIASICWYLLKINHNKLLIYHLVPWLSILSYTLISAVITTAGRLGFGIEQSLESRYVTFSTYGLVALIYLIAIINQEVNHQPEAIQRNYRQIINLMVKIFIVAMLLLYPFNFIYGIKAFSVTHQERLFGKSCLSLINVVPDQACIERYIYPNFAEVFERANQLNSMGLLQPSLLVSDRLSDISRDNLPQISYGFFDSLTVGQDNSYTASGWSVLPLYNTPAHAVILAYQTADAVDHPFAIVKPELMREDVWHAIGKKEYLHSGWSKKFSAELIPPNALAISAWSFDSKLARAYKFQSIKL